MRRFSILFVLCLSCVPILHAEDGPSQEKKLDHRPPGCYLHWDCADAALNPELWLKYYATDFERQSWAESNFEPLSDREQPPYPRQLPRQPL